MGLLTKKQVEENQRLKRQKKIDKKRKVGVRNPHVSFLIVCEGERTEPLYFEALIQNRNSDVREVQIEGEGRGTVSLIKQTKSIMDRTNKEYDRVWAVFDKDDFKDFNQAIHLANRYKINCAWCNESFELWYYLHFQYLDTGVSRAQYIKMIEREVCDRSGNPGFSYAKKSPENYNLLQKYGDEEFAIKNAEKLREFHVGTNYEKQLPCTTVDILVRELNKPELLLE